MRPKTKQLLLWITVFALNAIWWSCSKDTTNGQPYISYMRVTNPAASDSLLTTAGQGQMIAIIGGNLQSVQQIWFNDQEATLLPTFITNTTIITRVPSQLPADITNK